MKQVGPTGGDVPPSVVKPSVREGGQPTVRVYPDDEVIEVTPNVPPSFLAKRKHDDDAGVLGRKKSRAPLNLQAMKQVDVWFGSPLSC